MEDGDLTIRLARPDDLRPVVELLNRVPLELYGEPEFTEDQVLLWWRDPKSEQWVVERADGALAGVAGIGIHDEGPGRKMFLGVTSAPEAARRLLRHAEERARELAAPEAVVRTQFDSADEDKWTFWEEAGYRLVRHWFHMSIDLGGDLQEATWPEGIRPRPFFRGADDRDAYEADMEAFADHWDFSPTEYERWRLWTVERPEFDPSLWVLADADGEIAGFSFNDPHRSGVPGVGRVSALAVRRPWRRRGLGLALLQESFRVLRGAGFTEARLEVDAANPTGAVRLYERAGMHVIRTYVTYEKQL
jgi:mycothiol synthase